MSTTGRTTRNSHELEIATIIQGPARKKQEQQRHDQHLVISCSLASSARSIHRSSHAKNLMNLTYKRQWTKNVRWKVSEPTDPINLFNTPIRLSLAASKPFWIRMLHRAMKLFNGHPASRTTNPAKALHPSEKSGSQSRVSPINIQTKWKPHWNRKIPAIMISNGAIGFKQVHLTVRCSP